MEQQTIANTWQSYIYILPTLRAYHQLSAFPAGLGRPEAGAGYPEVVAGYPEAGAGYPGVGAGYHGRRALEVPYALPSFTHSWDETAEYPPPSSRHPPLPALS
jgi:hypothetical protein